MARVLQQWTGWVPLTDFRRNLSRGIGGTTVSLTRFDGGNEENVCVACKNAFEHISLEVISGPTDWREFA